MARMGYCRHDNDIRGGLVCAQCEREVRERKASESARIAEIRRIVREELSAMSLQAPDSR